MRFKLDENLPPESCEPFRRAGHDADTVVDEGLAGIDDDRLSEVCRGEGRVLVTLDTGFADIRSFQADLSPGVVVLRVARQDKSAVLRVIERVVMQLEHEPLQQCLWIAGDTDLRIRRAPDVAGGPPADIAR